MIILLGALTSIGPLNIDMYLPAFPTITNEFQTTASIVQLSLTGGLIGLAVGQLIGGTLSDIYGRRKPLMISLILFCIASILCAFAPSIWFLIVLRLIQGAAGGAGIVIARACVRDMYSGSDLTRVYSILVLIMGLAPILAPIIGGLLLKYMSWRGIFFTLFALGAVMLTCIIFIFSETLVKEKRTTGGFGQTLFNFKSLLVDRIFLGYALALGFSAGAMFAYISGSPFVIQEIYELSPQMYSLLFAMNAFGLVVASQLTGRLSPRFGETRFLMIGIIMSFVGGLLLLVFTLIGSGLVPVSLAFFLIVSSTGFINTSSISLAMQSQSKNAGSASALLGLMNYGIGGMVAPIVGILGSQTAIPLGIVIAVCSSSAFLTYLLLIRKRSLTVSEQVGVEQ
ncbi:multidrug effflux MFS transporter [Bacillus sp. B15-48]|uniref:Bcr/CflA family efflux MFS transporter n=1 Tax=Bacillus sp. B15-48 TaxID=1548601 RepID=UPI00193F122B|nr:Bcr/CflA family efflux MFS transporter [Bacillus sp. B15-48]